MTIKRTSVTNKPYTVIKNKKYYGFQLHKLPKKFASTNAKEPIKDWFNFRGFTFISRDYFIDMFGNVTIE